MNIEKNDEFVVEIERYGASGEGVAVKDGKIIFVPFACVGEKVEVHVICDKKNFVIAKPLKFLTQSDERVIAPCPYFEKCGGCDIQHLDYLSQLKLKKKIVENSFEKYAKISTDVLDVIPSSKKLRYRNKFSFPVQQLKDGEIKVGMYRKNSHDVVSIDDCLLQSEKTQKILKIFKNYMKNNKISAYNEQTHSGTVKHIVVRESEDAFILTVVVTDKKFNNFEPLISALKSEFKNFGIIKNVNNLQNNVIFGNIDEKIFGLDELSLTEFNINYFVNNRSFLQVNDEIKTKIYSQILDLINPDETVIDAYSGAGLLSAILSKKANSVFGIEIVPEATKNAENLKKINKLENLTNICGDCAEILPKLAEKLENFSIVLDPPRKGVDAKVLDSILKSHPQKIIYLSCSPSTLARDLKILCDDYQIEFVQPYDMFPQTANVETLVYLRRNENGTK